MPASAHGQQPGGGMTTARPGLAIGCRRLSGQPGQPMGSANIEVILISLIIINLPPASERGRRGAFMSAEMDGRDGGDAPSAAGPYSHHQAGRWAPGGGRGAFCLGKHPNVQGRAPERGEPLSARSPEDA